MEDEKLNREEENANLEDDVVELTFKEKVVTELKKVGKYILDRVLISAEDGTYDYLEDRKKKRKEKV